VAFYIGHNTGVSHTITPVPVMMPAVCPVRDHQEYENDYSVTMEEPMIDDKDWPKTMESIREYLGAVLGKAKIQLAYVIGESGGIPGGTDPSDA
jgi:hypothetical protein